MTSPELFNELRAERARIQSALLATNTVIGYGFDWKVFERWCAEVGSPAVPAMPDTVCLFIAAELKRGKKVSTIARRVAAIQHHHRSSGLDSPVTNQVHDLMRAARRLRNDEIRRVLPIEPQELKSICSLLVQDGTPFALRNRAIFVTGFCSALRSATLVALRLSDVEITQRGVIVRVRREKQDQEGKGRLIGLPAAKDRYVCPVDSLRNWLKHRGSKDGPLFTHVGSLQGLIPERINLLLKQVLKRIGLDPTCYGSHSLRAGFVTAAAEAGATDLIIATQTGHRDMDTLRGYLRRNDLWRVNACAMIGL